MTQQNFSPKVKKTQKELDQEDVVVLTKPQTSNDAQNQNRSSNYIEKPEKSKKDLIKSDYDDLYYTRQKEE